MSIEMLLLFLVLALLAEILGTVGGFGSSLFFVPIAGFFLDFHTVLGVTALFHVLSNLTKIGFFQSGFDKKIILTMGLPAVAFVILGAYLSKFIEAKILEIVLSIFLIGLSLFFFIGRNIKIEPNRANSIIGGVLSGTLAGLVGTGGAIRGMVLTAFNLKKSMFIATSAAIDLGIDLSRSIVYFSNGYVQKDILYLIPLLFVVSILGTFLGKKLLDRISDDWFRKIVLSLIFLTGLITLVKFLF